MFGTVYCLHILSYLSFFLPLSPTRPNFLPINVTIILAPLSHRLANVLIYPTDTCADIKRTALARLKDEGFKVAEAKIYIYIYTCKCMCVKSI